MDIVTCTNCRGRVMPSPSGECPSCALPVGVDFANVKAAISDDKTVDEAIQLLAQDGQPSADMLRTYVCRLHHEHALVGKACANRRRMACRNWVAVSGCVALLAGIGAWKHLQAERMAARRVPSRTEKHALLDHAIKDGDLEAVQALVRDNPGIVKTFVAGSVNMDAVSWARQSHLMKKLSEPPAPPEGSLDPRTLDVLREFRASKGSLADYEAILDLLTDAAAKVGRETGTQGLATPQSTARKRLPFDLDAKVSFITQGMFRFDSAMNPSPASRTHPSGSISDLKLDGVTIPLVSDAIRDGLITTEAFGQLEVFHGPDGIELWGTDSQKAAIEQHIKQKTANQTLEDTGADAPSPQR